MKKVKVNGKLSLSKESVTKLNQDEMNQVNGGFTVVATRAGGACNTNNHSCFNRCASWISCAA